MTAVGLFVHHEREDAIATARSLHRWLVDQGVEVRLPAKDATIADLDECGFPEELIADDDLTLAVAIGGDGTMLRTVQLVHEAGTPVLGVNVGQLGYLTEVEPEEAVDAIARVLRGDHGIEERMLVSITVEAAAELGPIPSAALNEIVVEKTPMGHTVRIAVSFDGDEFTTYAADGLIVATPTGSTAYSFSARGPILDPDLRALVLTPVSPHMLFDRSMVLRPDLHVRLEVAGHRPATISIDGRTVAVLQQGDAVVCTGGGSARLVTFAPRDFHRILRTKFGLPDR